jgi:hypothetical protein
MQSATPLILHQSYEGNVQFVEGRVHFHGTHPARAVTRLSSRSCLVRYIVPAYGRVVTFQCLGEPLAIIQNNYGLTIRHVHPLPKISYDPTVLKSLEVDHSCLVCTIRFSPSYFLSSNPGPAKIT